MPRPNNIGRRGEFAAPGWRDPARRNPELLMRQPKSPPIDPVVIEEMLTTRNSKWTLIVVLHLRRETMRFSELQRDIGSISQKALTASLRALERDGFVSRTSYATIPPRVDYVLTELGQQALVGR